MSSKASKNDGQTHKVSYRDDEQFGFNSFEAWPADRQTKQCIMYILDANMSY